VCAQLTEAGGRLGVDLDLLQEKLLLELLGLVVLLLVGQYRPAGHRTDQAGLWVDEEHLLLHADLSHAHHASTVVAGGGHCASTRASSALP
jgi:hypothetical protein